MTEGMSSMMTMTTSARALSSISQPLRLFSLSALSLFLLACVEPISFTPTPPTVPTLRLPMNNAYLGSVHSSDLRPKFVWEPSTAKSDGDIRYELQLSTNRDFEGDQLEETVFETEYQPDMALPVSFVPPVGARYFWRVRACLGNSCSEYSRTWYANVGRVVKDYNCDGYSDLAAGAPGEDSVESNAGRIRIYFGGRATVVDNDVDGLVGSHREIRNGDSAGYAVNTAGDVNGDGCADLILGVRRLYGDMIGVSYLFLGMPGETFDGNMDTRISTGQLSDGFGAAVGGTGDLNGDGFDDFYVSTYTQGDYRAAVSLYYGEPSSRNNTDPDGFFEFSAYSVSVSSAGDVNGDGAADLIIGDHANSSAGPSAGAANLYWGSFGLAPFDTEADSVLKGRGFLDYYGATVASAGDVNGDGFADILVANIRAEDNGRGQPGSVDIFWGRAEFFEERPAASLMGTIGNDLFGGSLSGVGDVNGDGYGDVLVGASHSDLAQDRIDAGKAYLYLGGEGVFDSQVDATFEGVLGFEALGEQASSGDFNGDGVRVLESES